MSLEQARLVREGRWSLGLGATELSLGNLEAKLGNERFHTYTFQQRITALIVEICGQPGKTQVGVVDGRGEGLGGQVAGDHAVRRRTPHRRPSSP